MRPLWTTPAGKNSPEPKAGGGFPTCRIDELHAVDASACPAPADGPIAPQPETRLPRRPPVPVAARIQTAETCPFPGHLPSERRYSSRLSPAWPVATAHRGQGCGLRIATPRHQAGEFKIDRVGPGHPGGEKTRRPLPGRVGELWRPVEVSAAHPPALSRSPGQCDEAPPGRPSPHRRRPAAANDRPRSWTGVPGPPGPGRKLFRGGLGKASPRVQRHFEDLVGPKTSLGALHPLATHSKSKLDAS